MSGQGIGVTHKELLTFSNLTNLEWEFVDLKSIKERTSDVIEGNAADATKLSKLLTPEEFVERDEKGEKPRRKMLTC